MKNEKHYLLRHSNYHRIVNFILCFVYIMVLFLFLFFVAGCAQYEYGEGREVKEREHTLFKNKIKRWQDRVNE